MLGIASALLLASSAAHADRGYAVAAGVALPLTPFERVGASAGISTVVTDLEMGPAALVQLRGELLGIASEDGLAALPQLSGDIGLRAGALTFALTGGVQLFGVAARRDYTLFSVLGLVGGGGISYRIHRSLSLDLRALVTWLPPPTLAILERPELEGTDKPSLLFVTGMLGLVYHTDLREPPIL